MPNIVNDPIISREKIIFPPLHIKLSLIKQFVRALNTDGEYFQHSLGSLCFVKIEAGVFDGSQICALIWDKNFVRKM